MLPSNAKGCLNAVDSRVLVSHGLASLPSLVAVIDS